MRVWIPAILIAILAGALQAGNWSGQDDIPLTSGGDMPDVALVGGAGSMAEDRAVEVAFMRLLRGAGADVADSVGRVRVKADRDAGQTHADITSNRKGGAIYGFGVAALWGNSPAPGSNVLRQMFDDISLGTALPAIDRFTARVWFGF
ncbi:MAG: hypothetical protein COC12_08015 [Rhodobacteraceae bacterium]|nr:MAG: hypothetical protein COC12_08015 [Paracoccaceae bacterium]